MTNTLAYSRHGSNDKQLKLDGKFHTGLYYIFYSDY
jgi:hypothetical protein